MGSGRWDKLGSWTHLQCVCVWRLLHANQQCPDTSWVAMIQLNSDTIYLAIAADPMGYRLILPPAPFQILVASPGCYLCF